jgi:hypothetical protein
MADAAEQSSREKNGSSLDDNLRDWFSGLGQGLGNLARSVVNGFDSLWSALDDEDGQHAPSREPVESLDELLGKLGQLINQHAKQGYDAVAQSGELERLLVRALRSVRRSRFKKKVEAVRAARVTPADEKKAAPAPAPEPAPAEAPPPAAAPAAAADESATKGSKGKKKKGKQTAEDEVELPEGVLEEFDSGESEE